MNQQHKEMPSAATALLYRTMDLALGMVDLAFDARSSLNLTRVIYPAPPIPALFFL